MYMKTLGKNPFIPDGTVIALYLVDEYANRHNKEKAYV